MKINFLFILLIIPYFLIIETTIASKSEDDTDIKSSWDWDFLHNNARIRNAFSFKEKALYNGLLFLPVLYKYRNNIWDIFKPKTSRKHSPQSNRNDRKQCTRSGAFVGEIGETAFIPKQDIQAAPEGPAGGQRSLMNNLKREFNDFETLFSNIVDRKNLADSIKILFDNTILRMAVLYLFAPRIFNGIERFHKFTINNWNEDKAKNIFLTKESAINKKKEIQDNVKDNHPILSLLFNQLLQKNPNIKSQERIKNETQLYIELTEIKEILNTYKASLEANNNLESIENEINIKIKKLNIDPALRDIKFIISNYKDILELTPIKPIEIKKYSTPLKDTEKEIKTTLDDTGYMTRNKDLNTDDSWKIYENKLKKEYPKSPYTYSLYVNENTGKKPLFDETSRTAELI